MMDVEFLAVVILFLNFVYDVTAHGGLVEPPMRSVMWKYGFDSPVNYDWMSLYCGGFAVFQQNGGRCGLCGDQFQGPYENDRGGVYDTGIIVRHYPAGLNDIEIKVEITAHHKGYFRFKLCPNNEGALTQQCLDQFPLMIREGRQQGDPFRYFPPENPKLHELHVSLPPDVTCDRCVLQWTYTAGNSVGQSADGTSCLGCGLQETFVNCADISIGGTVDNIPVSRPGNQPEILGPEVVIPATADDVTLNDVMRQFGIPAGPINPVAPPLQGGPVGGWNQEPVQAGQSQMSNIDAGFDQTNSFQQPWSQQSPSLTHFQRIQMQQQQQMLQQQQLQQQRHLQQLQQQQQQQQLHQQQLWQQQQLGFNGELPVHDSSANSNLLNGLNPMVQNIRAQRPNFLNNNLIMDQNVQQNDPLSSHHSNTGIDVFGNQVFQPEGSMISNIHQLSGRLNTGNQVTNWQQQQQHLASSHNDFASATSPQIIRSGATSGGLVDMRMRQTDAHRRFPSHMMNSAQPRVVPRRIVVPTVEAARSLLQRYPQLQGRVFLSREAQMRFQQEHMFSKYRFRQQLV